jgi:hypothetical protein
VVRSHAYFVGMFRAGRFSSVELMMRGVCQDDKWQRLRVLVFRLHPEQSRHLRVSLRLPLATQLIKINSAELVSRAASAAVIVGGPSDIPPARLLDDVTAPPASYHGSFR